MAVERYLQSQGISGEQMYSAGFGEAKPRETKAKSRRVEIVVILQP
ncbi:MAG: OmpA family protein [Ralstonia sp.]